jgi:hypothetical protein
MCGGMRLIEIYSLILCLLLWDTCLFLQNYKVYFRLYPSSGIYKTKNHNVSKTGSVSVLRWMGQDRHTQLGPLERASLSDWYGCSVCSVSNPNLRLWLHAHANVTEAPKLRGQNRMLWRIFKPKKEDVTLGWRKLHSDRLNNFCSSPNIWVI